MSSEVLKTPTVTAIICGLLSVHTVAIPVAAQDREAAMRTAADVIASSAPEEWRALDPENTVYLELPGGRVVMELAPDFAPRHVENIKRLVRGGRFNGGMITRSQDNYVVQWGPREPSEPHQDEAPFLEGFAQALPAEFEVGDMELPFTPVPDGDVYAPSAGFVLGFPVGRDEEEGQTWMAHCYGVVGVARGNDPGSGNGSGLYVVIGQAPRHLDRNLSMVGRIVRGMEFLSSLPRGSGSLGRFESREEWIRLGSVRMGADLPSDQNLPIEVLRTDSESFLDLRLASRSRHEDFFVHPSDRIGLCNVNVPSRLTN